jgi:hypothetical protein
MAVKKVEQVPPGYFRQENRKPGLIYKTAVIEELPNGHADRLSRHSALGLNDKFPFRVIKVRVQRLHLTGGLNL